MPHLNVAAIVERVEYDLDDDLLWALWQLSRLQGELDCLRRRIFDTETEVR